MQRRTLLKLGVGLATVLAITGGGLSLWRPGLVGGRLSTEGRNVFRAVARAVLDGVLPHDTTSLRLALDEQVVRLDVTVAALSPAVQVELSRLLALLSTAPGRIAFASLSADWPRATVAHVQQSLEAMRTSNSTLQQHAYHALRDLTMAAYFSDPTSWDALGYPGPLDI